MKKYSTTRTLRQKLHITQTELGLLTRSRRAMVARHEAGEKALNVYASSKLALLLYCVNGHFEAQAHLHHAAPATLVVTNLTAQRLQLRHRTACLRLEKARRRLQRMDETREELQVTIRRMAQINLTQLAPFTPDDEAWKALVVERLRLKLVACSGEQRFKLRTEIAQLEASIAVLEHELIALVEPFNQHIVVGPAEHLAAQPAEEDNALEVVAVGIEHHAARLDRSSESVGIDLLGAVDHARDASEKRVGPFVGRMPQVAAELFLEPLNHEQSQLSMAEFELDNERDHAPFEAPFFAHHPVNARIGVVDLTEHPVGRAVIGGIEMVHRQIEAHVNEVALFDARMIALQAIFKQRNRPLIAARIGVHRRLEHHTPRPQGVPLARLTCDDRLQLSHHLKAARKRPNAVEGMGLHVEKLRLHIGLRRRERLCLH